MQRIRYMVPNAALGFAFGVLACSGLVSCSGSNSNAPKVETPTAKKLEVTSGAIKPGEPIDKRYTFDGENVSPPLTWSGAPPEAESYAIVVENLDTPERTWVHWVLYDLPSSVTSLDEGVPRRKTLDNGAKQGMNDKGETGYNGPSPPEGQTHRYVLHVYALDKRLGLPAGQSRFQLIAAMSGHIVAEGETMFTYGR